MPNSETKHKNNDLLQKAYAVPKPSCKSFKISRANEITLNVSLRTHARCLCWRTIFVGLRTAKATRLPAVREGDKFQNNGKTGQLKKVRDTKGSNKRRPTHPDRKKASRCFANLLVHDTPKKRNRCGGRRGLPSDGATKAGQQPPGILNSKVTALSLQQRKRLLKRRKENQDCTGNKLFAISERENFSRLFY